MVMTRTVNSACKGRHQAPRGGLQVQGMRPYTTNTYGAVQNATPQPALKTLHAL